MDGNIKGVIGGDGLKTIFKILLDNFRRREEAKLNAGLIVKRVEGDIFGDENSLKQNTYYYKLGKVNKVKTYDYLVLDDEVMGEVVLEFSPKENVLFTDLFQFGSNMEVVWKNADIIPKYLDSAQTYQIRLTTSNIKIGDKYRMFAEISMFEYIQPPTEKYIKIVYKGISGDTIQLANKNWLQSVYKSYNGSINGIFFNADVDNAKWEKLKLEDIVSNNQKVLNGNRAELMISINTGTEITFEELLCNIPFTEFSVNKIPNNKIASISKMFMGGNGPGSVLECDSIDLSGLEGYGTYNDCKSLLAYRRCNKLDLSRIAWNTIIDASGMFTYAINKGNLNILDELKNKNNGEFLLADCYNLSRMFMGCELGEYDFTGWKWKCKVNSNGYLDLSEMFKESSITDDQLSLIKNLISNFNKPSGSYKLQLNFGGMFENTNIKNAGVIEMDYSNYTNMTIDLSTQSMFKGCKELTSAPKINIINCTALNCSSMFAEVGDGSILSGNIRDWKIELIEGSNVYLLSMFYNSPISGTFYFMDKNKLDVSKSNTVRVGRMFLGSGDDFAVVLSIISPIYTDDPSSIIFDIYDVSQMFDTSYKGIIYISPDLVNGNNVELIKFLQESGKKVVVTDMP